VLKYVYYLDLESVDSPDKDLKKNEVPIDMRRLYRPPPHPFPSCADCVPFELVASAALLGKNYGGGGQIGFQIFTTRIQMAALSTLYDVTGKGRVRVIYQ
jgi:hypothetical protein